ncbi:hypothetical protein PVAND_014659 [Polypedilum vanderplanki]|uniref:Peroxidase n=1 Tax=Polypedilum vanderplanki TaxID=319348 RepID=A0A9J6BAU5_POLVA|nr:hypothetical protein PVAND_014659 [Polypedilum vanderplanki]
MKEKSKNVGKISNFQITVALSVLALSVFVFAGGPSFFNSINIIPSLRDAICLQQSTQPKCTPSKFRSLDGSCNNPDHPNWGMANLPYGRLLPAWYSDNYSAHPKSFTGNDLPNPRIISKIVFGEESFPDPEYTISMMQFGQFMAHDMGNTLRSSKQSCCSYSGRFLSNSPSCSDIHIPETDAFYGPRNINCMNFSVTVSDHDLECKGVESTPANPISSVTPFFDLSLIYGNSDEEARLIRSFKSGCLTIEIIDGYEWPPHDPNATTSCSIDSETDPCFLGGDTRINQSPHLTIIHVLFIREHNRIARELEKLNPHWSDEKLYQEARRICIGIYQYISYYEWLTIFLGTQNMLNLGMITHFDGDEYANDFDSSVNPAVFNEHSQAAFRFYHTQIEGHLQLQTESRDIIDTIAISDHFDNPNFTLYHFDELTRGMITQMSQLTDSNFDEQIREFLFKHKRDYGDDLRSIDITRGRDHGLASYNSFRDFCGLPKATKWEDYLDLISLIDLQHLQEVYEDYRDVELSVGALLEAQIDNTTLAGPTLLCIFNIQFLNSKIGDRYWFESGDPEIAFTRPQLAEIRKSSFARIVCDNSHNVTSSQLLAFRTVRKDTNPIVPCTEIPFVNLTFWTE